MTKYYFQAPNFDINADSPTAPRLGSIFAKPGLKRLSDPMNKHEHLTIPADTINELAPSPFSETVWESLAVSLGLSLKALLVGEGNVLYRWGRSNKVTYRAEGMGTVEFAPDAQFVRDSIVASQRVQAFLDASLTGTNKVYMVTGLKIATGFSQVVETGRTHGPQLGMSVDGAAAGIPLEAGPELSVDFGRERVVSQGGTALGSGQRIVFAYKVVVIRRKRDGDVAYDWKNGGRYAIEDDEEDEDEEKKSAALTFEPVDDENLDNDGPEGFVGEPLPVEF
ncbi:hypothetical protein QBC42DRAFT_332023 [Cladorrhinum samala]|uniref:Uncharacterized protein n=1 Tax=Cladorrhinum samala TaxID=585594 RepID=A0AAV9HIQ7_9PEZI|nr:hypothetical protein QBC42DRAFT_332023 [Cladorrhinum samala]